MESEGKFRIKIYRHCDDEREVLAECSVNFPIKYGTHDAEGMTVRYYGRPKIVNCKPKVRKEVKEVIEKIEAQLENEVGNEFRSRRGIGAIIKRYKLPSGGKVVGDYSWTIEVLDREKAKG